MRRRPFLLGAAALASAGVAGCSPLAVLNAGADESSVKRDIAYGIDPRQRLDLYLPPTTTAQPAAGRPVAVFFYGGSWNSGDRANYGFVGSALAARGVLTAVADYRLYPQVRYPTFVEDSAAAVAWMLRNAASHGGDARQVYVMGHSAGGYNAAMVALDERWLSQAGASTRQLAGWLGLAGPYDFIPIINPKVQPVFHHPNVPRDSQPIHHVHAGAPRSFVATAAKDTLVDPQRNAIQLAGLLKTAGVNTSLKIYENTNHFTLVGAIAAPLRFLAPVLDDIETFIKSG